MGDRVSYSLADGTATITMDDGKANALSIDMIAALGEAVDRAEADGAVVVLTGRPGMFSGGFDLGVVRAGGLDLVTMVRRGFELAHRLLSFPNPVVIACTGHAMAMGAFLLLSGDYRIGVSDGAHRISANEVAIGMTMPETAMVVCRQRLTPAAYERAITLAEVFGPDAAVAGGFLDAAVPAAELADAAAAKAAELGRLDRQAHRFTKLRSRGPTLERLLAAIEHEDAALRSRLAQ